MIRITVEIVPFGVETHKRTISTMEIINDGTGSPHSGNYYSRLDGKLTGKTVKDFARSRGSWELIKKFLED